jgi:acetolactate synthase I/II/III large subunit
MKVSDYIASFLYVNGIDHVFELSGGMITHILDSIHKINKTKIISMHHEQSASFAADAFGRVKGIPGVALATSGPGATNLITGIASCYFDSSPAIFITGQVNTHEQKKDRKIRQLGFQETNIIEMVRSVTKASYMITTAESIPQIFEAAFLIAIQGRPGPVIIDIPMNLQRADIIVNEVLPVKPKTDKSNIPKDIMVEIIQSIQQSKRPLILAGRGIKASFSQKLFLDFVEKTKIPVVLSLLGLDILPYENKQRVGYIGAYGNRWANHALGDCDLLIVIGSRLDIRQTGADVISFKGDKKIYHIDCESAEINNRISGCIEILADIKDFFISSKNVFAKYTFEEKLEWNERIQKQRSEWSDTNELKDIKGINPNLFIKYLSENSDQACGYVADVGNHQMWTAQSLRLKEDQVFLTSGGMGAMGFALPASIGLSMANKNKPVVIIAGDGGFQINIQEIQTIVRNNLPIKMIVLNNKCLGMIRQFQDSYFESKYQSTFWGYSAPDFEKIAIAYGVKAHTIIDESEISGAIKKMWENKDAPFLLQVMIDSHVNAYPKIAFGKPITEMEPNSKPIDMEGT